MGPFSHVVAVASALAPAPESLFSIARINEQATALGYGSMESARPHLSVRHPRDPPKNTEGQIYCDHTDCQAAPPTFRRPCEWKKHMDKHDRPYKCYEPGCDKIQGLTYSGGLLHHQREVHKKNNDTKEPLMCPYTDCNRSTGNGFTRRENLREHLRRRHMHTDDGLTTSNLMDMPGERANPNSDENCDDLRNEVKRLRREMQKKDRRLEQLERIVTDLQKAIRQPSMPEHGPQFTQAMPSAAQCPGSLLL
ncbi:hypothetical protein N7539_008558 [Penicillium diatomitis]|uniref:C2H2-type domain-containing protein n=1 Tax=Penicillium diatomitis TaxID=2819901 RepID=A0A9W9WR07_9EURO|nr:uncharacterized protein N7539_008558 [Penicillium diatomitis]KAJ5471989.1 hypothetical protein N7539_008558 [Penicillium diatomitis]